MSLDRHCPRCCSRRVIGLDRALPIHEIVDKVKWCLVKQIPFLPIDLSTSIWKSWIRRIPFCVELVTEQGLPASGNVTTREKRSLLNCQSKASSALTEDVGRTDLIHPELLGYDDIIYIVTTSGTTSPLPKIVYVTQSSVEPNITDFQSQMNINADSVLYCTSPLTFDPAILNVLLSIRTGAQLVTYSDGAKDPLKLLQFLNESKVTHIQTVPSFLRLLRLNQVASCLLTNDTSVQVICMGGEPCLTGDDLHTMCNGSDTVISKVKFYNLYGLTEQSVWSGIHQIDSQYIRCKSVDAVPVGRALTDTEFVMSRTRQVDPVQVNDLELVLRSNNRLCYIDDGSGSLSNSLNLHTGDLFTADLVFMGRRDADFVKIGVARVNLLSLSQKVQEVEGVQHTYCMYEKLCGLVIAYTGKAVVGDVQLHVDNCDICPGNTRVMKFDMLPINSHGKVDRRALLTDIQQHMKLHTNDVLSHIKIHLPGDVQLDKSFIQNGGSSIQALALSQQLSEMIGEVTTLHVVLQYLLSKNIQKVCTFISELTIKHNKLSVHDPMTSESRDQIQQTRYCREDLVSSELKIKHNKLSVHDQMTSESRDQIQQTGHCREDVVCEPEEKIARLSKSDLDEQSQLAQKCCLQRLKGTITQAANRNAVSLSLSSVPLTLEFIWTVDTGKCVDASPVAVSTSQGSFIYIGSHSHRFLCIRVSDGHVMWATTLGNRIEATAAVSLEHGLLYVGCYDNYLYCLNIRDGQIIHRVLTGDVIKSTPALHVGSNCVYFGSHDHYVYCIHEWEVGLKWKKHLDGAIYTTPLLYNNILYVSTLAGAIYILDKRTGDVIERVNQGSPIFSSPVACTTGVVECSVDGYCMCRDYDSLDVLWSYKAEGNIFSTPAIIESTQSVVFGCHDNKVYNLNYTNGVCLWSILCDSPITSSPCPYTVEGNAHVVVTSTAGTVYNIDISTGSSTTIYSISASVFGSPILIDNKLIVGSRDDNIYCLQLDTKT